MAVLAEDFFVPSQNYITECRNDQAGHTRTLDRAYQRQDTQSIVKDFANLEPKAFMDMIINTLTR